MRKRVSSVTGFELRHIDRRTTIGRRAGDGTGRVSDKEKHVVAVPVTSHPNRFPAWS